ncbi:hypothetical protein BDA96_03G006200 [Sorghum bicolor]|uniref:Rx N-terminal domain-containing protein n=2 Tax=Sorghum bicolor TaxID=4558 RepID=A0A921R8P5_SORBI|nr:hypothetical protein BDA96_03G006200 [Sorghum bicolor]KXG31480.1 hypothetical protein SORBI_3003G006100 [Sorghum bicolor]
MAALTQSAIDAVLGTLATAIQDDLRLIGSVHSDMKFIKDEMDSMNGFLMHLNKMESEKHDDRVRAWMKQVREVSYVSEDCVDRYRRVLSRYGGVGCWGGGGGGGCACAGTLLFILAHPMAYLELRNLGTQIAELKARVRDVGERRQRYDVSVPIDAGGDHKMEQNKLPEEEEEKRKLFVHDELEKDVVGTPGWFRRSRAKQHAPVGQLPLPAGHPSDEATKMMMGAILEKCRPREAEADVDPREAAAFRCTRKMFLCAMYMYPSNNPTSSQELSKLKEKVEGVAGAQEARKQVMIFCYSILTTQQKSCLQYLTAFLHETKISRTSMVRRWVAEGLVGGKDVPGGGGGGGGRTTTTTTPEEAGERCFSELLLRGFIRANGWSDAGTVKSCVMDEPVRDFIEGITKSENFVVELPAHLDRQLKIRSIVQRRASMAPPPPLPVLVRRCCNLRWCGGRGCTWLLDDHRASSSGDDATAKDPMDELVEFIRALPEQYRLNVLDLGGCTGLNKSRHLKSFAEVECLKYLSLRNTDVRRLHARLHINKLTLLETLDIRDTNIPPRDTVSIYLPKLKHLLAGRFLKTSTTAVVEKASLVTVRMPDRIGSMRDMETLSHVQVSMDGAELQGVAKLHQLRKLGVVVHGNTTTAALLGRVLYMLAANLRSLSIWVAIADAKAGGGGILDISSMYEMASSLVLENLDIKGKMSLPLWIGRASKLVNVTLRDTEMDGGDALRRLATVQSLRCLKLSGKAFTEQALRFMKDVQFQALKFLVVEGDAVTRIVFLDMDAAPKLHKIVWAIGGGSKIEEKYDEDLITGIHLLPDLKVIELRATFNLANLLEWTKPQTTSANPSAASTETPSPSAGTPEPPSAASSAENPSAASAKNPTYRIRYISSSDGQLITELPSCTDEKLSLPAGIINYNKQ